MALFYKSFDVSGIEIINKTRVFVKTMKSIVFCGSTRFKEEMREFMKKLKEKGVVVFEPFLYNDPGVFEMDGMRKKLIFLGLTWHHFEYIRKADVVFMFNKDGYMGNSTTLELGFASALGKPIYALEKDKEELARDVLIDEYIGSAEKLLEKLK